ncbi:Hypothetical predicted protein [Pelobates cultripes]|uniref:Uncharacterized protein n=1 Tax=Pelobates cultripes TaxID=61616 RepID=A0AAD1SV39_PELCU|nr:Hypothetical predicted protein [Pelobates cultripes]
MQNNRPTRRQTDDIQAPTLSDNMGKQNKKLKTHPGDRSQKIGDMFLSRPKPNMAATLDPQTSSSEEEEVMDEPDPIPEAADPLLNLPLGDLGAPATKGDILNILKNIRTLFRTDIAVLQEDLTAVAERVRATEEDVTSVAQRQQATEEKLRLLQVSHHTLQARIDGLDDARRRTNLKIRGIDDSIDDKELPQFTRCLLTTILNPKQAKTVQIESTYRLQKSPRAPAGASCDVLLRFLSNRDKMVGASTFRLMSPDDSSSFLGKLGLDIPGPNDPTPGSSWDVTNITPFVPRSAADTG